MESIHKQVTKKANLAVSQFQGRANGFLDYTPSSLKKIEEMLEEASQYINQMQKKK